VGPAQFDLGVLYAKVDVVPHDDEIAVHWWKRAVASGDMDARLALALAYESGVGTKSNFVEAHKLLSTVQISNVNNERATIVRTELSRLQN
jgi:TPR repeat protein